MPFTSATVPLVLSQTNLSGILDAIADGVVLYDHAFRILYVNAEAEQRMGLPRAELLGRVIWELLPDTIAPFRETLPRSLNERIPLTFEGENTVRQTWTECRCLPIEFDGDPHCLAVIFRDVTDKKEREHLLAEALDRADRDPLTGLLNHRAFYERLHSQIATGVRDGETLALILLDLNYFKFFNEAFGHPVGDAVLKQVASALTSCCREGDALGRLGGDEFALLLKESSEREAHRVVWEIESCIHQEGFLPPNSDVSIPLGFSFGVALSPLDTQSPREMVSLADQRLLWAKHGDSENGRASFPSEQDPAGESFALLDALVTAVDNKDRYTRQHSLHVQFHAQLIAEKLGMSDAERGSLRVSSLLHDVGKIGVPDRILRLPSHLSPGDFEIIKKHTTMGAAIIGAVPGMEHTIPAVRHHHEQWDGTGYPDGLAGEAIPLPARILAVADAYAAMTTDRPYRKKLRRSAARSVLEKGAGKQWDPAIVAAFVSSLPSS